MTDSVDDKTQGGPAFAHRDIEFASVLALQLLGASPLREQSSDVIARYLTTHGIRRSKTDGGFAIIHRN